MSDIVLSAGVRSNLLQLQQTSDLITSTQTKLATGKRVNSALDNANNFFTAQGLDNRASDLSSLLDGMSNAINTIQAANNGITSITKLVQSAQSLVSQAQQTSDTTVRASLAGQFDAIRTQIDQLASDSGFNGINLLATGASNALTVVLNEKSGANQSSVTINNTDTSSSGLGIIATTNSWANSSDITASSGLLTAALTTLRGESQTFGLQPVDRADPPGLHQGDRQHVADRFVGPHDRRLRTKKAPTCSPCRPASSCPRPLCRSPRRPTRTCSSCSNKLRQRSTPRRRPPGRRFF